MADDEDCICPPLGATGQYPDGRNHPDDAGELVTAWSIDWQYRVIRHDFGDTPVRQISTSASAREQASILLELAAELDAKAPKA